MASSDPVEVAVEIIDQFSDDLKKLEKQLDRIDGKKLSVTLDIDDGGDIEEVKAQLEALEKKIKTTLDINVKGHKKAFALKAGLSKDTQSVHRILTKNENVPGVGGGGGGGSALDALKPTPHNGRLDVTRTVNEIVDQQLKRLSLDGNPAWHTDFTMGREGHLFGEDGRPIELSNPETDFMRRIKKGTDVATGRGPDVPNGPMPDRPGLTRSELDKQIRWSARRNMVGNLGRNVGKGVRGSLRTTRKGASFFSGAMRNRASSIPDMDLIGGFGRKLAAMRPTMHKWMNLVALLIPMLITLAGAVIGVAAAFGGLAVAGGAVLGLGLLGYGTSIEESMKNAGIRIKELKEELFGVFQPVAQSFQPITEDFLDAVPHAIKPIADAMEGLDAFEGMFTRALYGGANWVADLITAIIDLQEPIERITMLVGGALGDALLNVFKWGVKEVDENWTAFADLAGIFVDLIVVLYNVSKAASFVITIFRPLFDLFAWFSDFLNNDFILGLLRLIATYYLLRTAIIGAGRAWVWFTGLSFTKWAVYLGKVIWASIGHIYSWITAVNGAKMAWRAFLASTGLGLVLVAGGFLAEGAMKAVSNVGKTGPAPSVGGSDTYAMGGGGGGTQINIYGNVGNSEYQKLKDEFPSLYREQTTIEEETEK
ncbi:hypothetical protein HTZ84_09500 [Haloterrigena sp. SYSU A558-1]|uniref:Uncharacterized protein n=1 Tax=Haloterrigena gelatinilytica TaxID=2741724 RepID=A0ABX2LDA5_9EURY|nr:hypothetical protein [Haloterrigena gelatinilytica]NUC72540.1 hypothetical protein [Haloterrigena gelatinilytica]